MKNPEPKPAGTWDFFGDTAPNIDENGQYTKSRFWETFSLGCFQWVPRANGVGTKKGKVQYRIRGRFDDPEPAFAKARAFCEQRNSGKQN